MHISTLKVHISSLILLLCLLKRDRTRDTLYTIISITNICSDETLNQKVIFYLFTEHEIYVNFTEANIRSADRQDLSEYVCLQVYFKYGFMNLLILSI